jgi:hypothetical protein
LGKALPLLFDHRVYTTRPRSLWKSGGFNLGDRVSVHWTRVINAAAKTLTFAGTQQAYNDVKDYISQAE